MPGYKENGLSFQGAYSLLEESSGKETSDWCNRGIDRDWAPKAGKARSSGPQGVQGWKGGDLAENKYSLLLPPETLYLVILPI